MSSHRSNSKALRGEGIFRNLVSVCLGAPVLRVCRALPVIASQHDQRVPSANSAAHRTRQHLVSCAHVAGGVHAHVGLVLVNLVEVEVAEVVDGVVWGRQDSESAISSSSVQLRL